jgi:hypothetical protein
MPKRASMSIRVSMLKRSMRPRIRSLTRGCVTPSRSPPRPASAAGMRSSAGAGSEGLRARGGVRPRRVGSRGLGRHFPLNASSSLSLAPTCLPEGVASRALAGAVSRASSSRFGVRCERFSNAWRTYRPPPQTWPDRRRGARLRYARVSHGRPTYPTRGSDNRLRGLAANGFESGGSVKAHGGAPDILARLRYFRVASFARRR